MAKKLYVGNLAYAVTDQDLKDLFSQSGAVETVAVISDKFSGQSKGFGFVEMADAAGAEAAIKSLDGTEFKGRNLKVNEAKPREGGSSGGPRGGGGGGGRSGDRSRWWRTWQSLVAESAQIGTSRKVRSEASRREADFALPAVDLLGADVKCGRRKPRRRGKVTTESQNPGIFSAGGGSKLAYTCRARERKFPSSK